MLRMLMLTFMSLLFDVNIKVPKSRWPYHSDLRTPFLTGFRTVIFISAVHIVDQNALRTEIRLLNGQNTAFEQQIS